MDIKLELKMQIALLRERRGKERVKFETMTEEINGQIDCLERLLWDIEKSEDSANDTIRED